MATTNQSKAGGHIATALALGALLGLVLRNTDFSLPTALIVGLGTAVILVGASLWSDAAVGALDWLAGLLRAILAVIVAFYIVIFAAILISFCIWALLSVA